MLRKRLMTAAVLIASLAMSIDAAWAQVARRASGASLASLLDPIRTRFELPALAAAVVRDGKIVASGAVGTRRAGAIVPVTIDDRFHIGSDTKAMTSLLAAMLVEGGKIRWNSTVAEVFPELAGTMDPDVKTVTLQQLLSHSSGIPSDNEEHTKLLVESFAQDHKNLDELRYWVIEQLVKQPLQSKPGERFAYANMGYTLAGAMLERVSGKTWEELIVERVFEPLGLKSAGLGPQSTLGRIDAPVGHEPLPDGTLKPMLAGPDGDNPEVIGPAGTAHLSVLDFATWAAWNAGEGKRGPRLVRPETLRKLHTPVMDMPTRPDAPVGTPSAGSYGFGWVTVTPPFAREPVLFHGGSNEMNVAYIVLEPKLDFGIVMMTNVGGRKADDAMLALGEALYKRFRPKRTSRSPSSDRRRSRLELPSYRLGLPIALMVTRDLDDDLELARRHVAEAEERVIAQRTRLAKMIEAGSNERGVVNAKRLLKAFENALAAMRDHLAVEENSYKRS